MEKKKTGLVITIIILAIMLLGLGGYVVYNNFFKTEVSNNEKDEKTNDDDKDNSDDGTVKLDEKTKVVLKFESLMDDYRLYSIDKYTNKITNFNNISNQDKLDLALDYLWRKSDFVLSPTQSVTLSNEYFKKAFADEITFENGDAVCHSVDNGECHIKFDKTRKVYTNNENSGGHGDNSVYPYYQKLVDIKKDGNLYTLTYVKLFYISKEGGYISEFYNSYLGPEPYIEIKEDLDAMYNGDYIKIEQKIKEIVDEKMDGLKDYNEFPKYKYTVKLADDDNVLLSGYEYVK